MPDYVATDKELPQTPIARWDANIAAIRLLKKLQSEGRQATPADQEVLAKYSGFGDSAFEQAFSYYTREPAWQKRREELQELVTDEEHDAIKTSRLNAFYTTPEVIRSVWSGLQGMGADKLARPKVLEPSAGSGRFLAYQPTKMAASSERTAVELDKLTAGLLKAQFPDTTVYNTGFENAPVPEDHFDIAISNVPFGNYGVHDPEYLAEGKKYLTGSIHNYFFAKAMDKLRPGGVLAFITTHHTMDAGKARRVREHLAEQADLVGAVRLPDDAFPDTDVVTDIIYLRKRAPGETPGDTSWVDTEPRQVLDSRGDTHTMPVNLYYVANPDMVLGKHSAEGTMYSGKTYTVKSDAASGPVSEKLPAATRRVAASPLDLTPAPTAPTSGPRRPARAAAQQESTSAWVERIGSETGDTGQAQRLAELGSTTRRLLNAEKGRSDEDTEQIRAELSEQYQGYVDSYKHLNQRANTNLLKGMADGPLLLALENYNGDTKKWERSSIFSRRLAGAAPERNVTNAADAMSVVMNESGTLDFQRMGQLMGENPNTARDTLAQERLIFRNPMGSWETASEYLTGRVRDNLEVARRVAANNPAYRANVAALEAAQPEEIPASQIATPLGAPWIPDSVVNEWVARNLSSNPWRGAQRWFKYNEESGEWAYNNKVQGYDATMRSQWGTDGMKADKILENVLKGTPINVTLPNPDGKGRVKDPVGTLAAQEKARQMQESFSEWIWEDPDRQERMVRVYNETHNATRPRVFDGSHLTFPGMDPKWQEQLREHQRDAIFRVVHDGTALLAHEVGFGKTAVMVASAMERKRLGLVEKPIFVVPQATYEQFERDFRDMYPGATLLAPKGSEFSKKNREVFLNRIATGDWDGVILTTEQFKNIPVKPQTEARWVEEQVANLESALIAALEEEGGGRGRESQTQKQIEKNLKREQKKLQDLRAEISAGTDKGVVHFEDLGVDQLYVDEADRYKNLPFATRMGQVKGLPNSESKRAWDMFLKTQYIQGQGERKSGSFADTGVVFATGTPIANTIAEAWTMMRYLQLPELRRRGLHHFDAWASTYGNVTSGMEQTPQGKYKVTQRFAKFVNLPELSRLFQNVADVRVASEVPEMVAVRPRLTDDSGNPKRTGVKAPNYPDLQAYMKHLRERVDKLPTMDPEQDNMLLISSDARKASLDLRMVDPTAKPNPNGKVQLAADRIAEIYRAEEADKGTQLVFLDLGTPKAGEKVEEDGEDEEDVDAGNDRDDLTVEEASYVSNVYGVLKRELIDRGIPASDIAFVQDHKAKPQREALFEKVRDGDVRVMVGSTETAGVGVNVQDRAAALHHLDVPWRPRDIEQREGRIIRQGNKVYGPVLDEETGEAINPGRGVKIYQYVQEGSFDEFMWQAVEVKGHAVKALMKRNINNRVMDDVDPLVLSAAEAKALASGNPLVLKAEELKNQVNTLRLERAAHRNQRDNARGQIKRLETVIEGYRERIPIMEVDAQLASEKVDKDKLTVDGRAIEKRADAGKTIEARLSGLDLGGTTEIGTYRGFDVSAAYTDQGYQVTVTNPSTDTPHNSTYIEEVNPSGLMVRLDNLVDGIPKALENAKTRLSESELSLDLYQEQASKPFQRGGNLARLERELDYTQAQLRGDADAVPPPEEAFEPLEADSNPVETLSPQPERETAAPTRETPEPGPASETASSASTTEGSLPPPYDPAVDEGEEEDVWESIRGGYEDRRAEKEANNQSLREWALKKLAQGHNLLFQIEGRGPTPLLKHDVVAGWQAKGHQPILVGSDGNLRVLSGQNLGIPTYSTVLSGGILSSDGQHMVINQPMTETQETEGFGGPGFEPEIVAAPESPAQPEPVAEDVAASGPEPVELSAPVEDTPAKDDIRESPETTDPETDQLIEEVLAVKADDGQISPREAEDTASAAGKLLQKAEEETPDPPSVTRTYDSSKALDALLQDLCEDPNELAALRERVAQAERRSQEQELTKAGKPDEIPDEVRQVAGEILAAKEKATPDKPKKRGGPRRVREDDADLLARLLEECPEYTLVQGPDQPNGKNGHDQNGRREKRPLPIRCPKPRSEDLESIRERELVPVPAKIPITPMSERSQEELTQIRQGLKQDIAEAEAAAPNTRRRRSGRGGGVSVGIASPAPGPGQIGGRVREGRYSGRTTADRFMRTRKVKARR